MKKNILYNFADLKMKIVLKYTLLLCMFLWTGLQSAIAQSTNETLLSAETINNAPSTVTSLQLRNFIECFETKSEHVGYIANDLSTEFIDLSEKEEEDEEKINSLKKQLDGSNFYATIFNLPIEGDFNCYDSHTTLTLAPFDGHICAKWYILFEVFRI